MPLTAILFRSTTSQIPTETTSYLPCSGTNRLPADFVRRCLYYDHDIGPILTVCGKISFLNHVIFIPFISYTQNILKISRLSSAVVKEALPKNVLSRSSVVLSRSSTSENDLSLVGGDSGGKGFRTALEMPQKRRRRGYCYQRLSEVSRTYGS